MSSIKEVWNTGLGISQLDCVLIEKSSEFVQLDEWEWQHVVSGARFRYSQNKKSLWCLWKSGHLTIINKWLKRKTRELQILKYLNSKSCPRGAVAVAKGCGISRQQAYILLESLVEQNHIRSVEDPLLCVYRLTLKGIAWVNTVDQEGLL